MKFSVESDNHRSVFLDNVRSLMVVLVLIFHAAASYGSKKVGWWPFHEDQGSIWISLFMMLCDVFMMAVLYFLAGYFAMPALEKGGWIDFLRRKLVRLGIPWLVVSILVLPILDYLHYGVQSAKEGVAVWSYGVHWLSAMKRIATFHTGWMDMSVYLNMTDHFYQRHMWFLSLLLLFFFIFALLHTCINKVSAHSGGMQTIKMRLARSPVLPVIIVVMGGTIIPYGLVKLFICPAFLGPGWFSIGNLIQFQFGKLVIYAGFFVLGCCAFAGKWFSRMRGFGKPWIWIGACSCLFGINMTVLKSIAGTDIPTLPAKLAFIVFYPVWAFSFLGLLISIAYKYWNRATGFNRDLAANSYNMYLAHYIFPMTLPLLMAQWSIPTLAKFPVVAVVTLLLSYTLSRYLLKPFPKGVMVGLVLFSVILAIVP